MYYISHLVNGRMLRSLHASKIINFYLFKFMHIYYATEKFEPQPIYGWDQNVSITSGIKRNRSLILIID